MIDNLQGIKKLEEFKKSGIISPQRMRAVDINAMELGVSAAALMESAGKSLALCAEKYAPSDVLVLCGGGKNGGDGFVAARYLAGSSTVHVIYPHDSRHSPESRTNLKALSHSGAYLYPVRCPEDVSGLSYLFSSADIIIDAILGTGLSGELREPYKTFVALANKSGALIISADIPTPGIHADTICAFHRPKQEGCDIFNIGIPLEAEICTGKGDLTLISRKKKDAHKGEGGRVLVIGGGPYQGAPYLAALSALRAGADIVRIATPNLMQYPDLIIEKLDGKFITDEHTEKLIELAKASDSVVTGCGLGDKSHNVISDIAPYCRKAVFDADALRTPIIKAGECIYTPHSGEFERMSGINLSSSLYERALCLRDFAKENGGTFILKGNTDIITDGDNVRFNKSGSPAMTKGGTGDVLAGLCGALLCRLSSFDAACIASYVNGCAGEIASEKSGDGIFASDVIENIAQVIYKENQ